MSTRTITAAYYRGNRKFEVGPAEAAPPGPGQVRLRIAYCGICGTDMHVFHGNMDARVGFSRIVGHEMSGVVEMAGPGVEGFTAGQKVVVRPLDPCGGCPACRAGHAHICHRLKFLGLDTDGAMQELWTVPAHTLHALPDTLPLEHAALVEPVAVACHAVRMAALAPGEDTIVIGGGPIGILVAMVAAKAGSEVVISEVNPHRLAIARRLGFETINPAKADLTAAITDRTGGKGADVAFEVSGSQAGVDAMTAVAATRARLVMVAIHAKRPEIDMFRIFWRELNLIGARVYEERDYDEAIALVTDGGIDAETIITGIEDLTAIQSAFEALDSNPTAMKTLIRVSEPG